VIPSHVHDDVFVILCSGENTINECLSEDCYRYDYPFSDYRVLLSELAVCSLLVCRVQFSSGSQCRL